MSGICAIYSQESLLFPQNLLGRMMQALEKHGPDGSATWHDASVGLGHQMLHITPESLYERLPLHHTESQIALTADARLDNREDLLALLNLPGTSGLTDSDLLLRAYQAWGISCVERLVGEFAFVVWDARQQCLHAFTDHMGVRPLFYTELPGRYFAVASEIVALLALSDTVASLNKRRLAMLGVSALSVYLEPEATCFENIYRIPAATVLSLSKAGKQIREYWQPDHEKRLNFNSDAECREAFQDVFSKAVKARLRSAFPVASLLSGGLDSSSIVSVASRILAEENRSLITLSSVPMPEARGQVVDERDYIDLFRTLENLEMHEVFAPGCGPFDDLESLVKTGSLCSYSFQHFLYTAFVREARKNGARVILDGHGGEFSASCELSGYMAELFLAGKWNRLSTELRHFEASQRISLQTIKRHVLRPLFPYSLLKVLNRHSRFKNLVPYPIRSDFVQDVLGFDVDEVKDQIFGLLFERPDHRRNMVHDILQERRDARLRSHAGFVDYEQATFSYPYFDKRVIEFGLAIDGRFKYQNGFSRRLVRLGMAGSVPEPVIDRTSKAPFIPDYHLRYEKTKAKAVSLLKDLRKSAALSHIVDFQTVLEAVGKKTKYNMQNPMRLDYESQFLVPQSLYLCYFVNNMSE